MKLSTHVSSQFDEDLTRLRSLILEMGGLVESQIADVIEIYTTGAVEKVQTIIDVDKKINEFEKRIDDDCANLIAKRQPAASDLRLVFGITKIVTDLERVGDETKRMAKVIRRIIENNQSFPNIVNIRHIAEAALAMIRAAMDAFARMESAPASDIIQSDDEVDAEFKSIMRQLITHMMENPKIISTAIDIIWMARAVERIGDHAKNIAEQVVFIVEGKDIRHQKLRGQNG